MTNACSPVPGRKTAPVCENKEFKFYPDRAELDLKEILNLNEADFDSKFADSAFTRLGLENLQRNAKVCLDNLTDGQFEA